MVYYNTVFYHTIGLLNPGIPGHKYILLRMNEVKLKTVKPIKILLGND